MKKCFCLFLISIQFCSFGQTLNSRTIYNDGLGLKIGGPTYGLALNYNHFFTHHLNLELGAGFVGAYAGVKYFFGKAEKKMRFAPYVGTELGYAAIIFDGFYPGVYVPIGVQFFSKNGFNISLEASGYFILGYGNIYGFLGKMGGVGTIPWGSLQFAKNF
jgi:hypothetical protein